jgi:hypothetical protein
MDAQTSRWVRGSSDLLTFKTNSDRCLQTLGPEGFAQNAVGFRSRRLSESLTKQVRRAIYIPASGMRTEMSN